MKNTLMKKIIVEQLDIYAFNHKGNTRYLLQEHNPNLLYCKFLEFLKRANPYNPTCKWHRNKNMSIHKDFFYKTTKKGKLNMTWWIIWKVWFYFQIFNPLHSKHSFNTIGMVIWWIEREYTILSVIF